MDEKQGEEKREEGLEDKEGRQDGGIKGKSHKFHGKKSKCRKSRKREEKQEEYKQEEEEGKDKEGGK